MIENINLNGATVSAELHGYMYSGVYGYNGVMDYGSNLSATIVSNNEIKLADGLICNAGRFMRIVGSESVKIANGSTGVTRKDLIVAHFETNGITETHDIRVIQGVSGGATPSYTNEDIYNGGKIHELPLYEVSLNGLTVEKVTQLFEKISSTNDILNKIRTNLFNPNFETKTYQGVTITKNGDGTYTLNGTSTAETWFTLGSLNLNGTYKLVGRPKDSLTYELKIGNGDWSDQAIDAGEGIVHKFNGSYNVHIWIPKGVTLTNVLVKPMITTDLNATYDGFVQFKDSLMTGEVVEQKIDKSDALSYEEIQASTDLTGKVASASAFSNLIKKSIPLYAICDTNQYGILYFTFNIPEYTMNLDRLSAFCFGDGNGDEWFGVILINVQNGTCYLLKQTLNGRTKIEGTFDKTTRAVKIKNLPTWDRITVLMAETTYMNGVVVAS